jgi:hypothetical protein
MRSAELVAVGAHDIGDFQGRPHRRGGLGFGINDGQREQIQGAGRSADRGRGKAEITGRGRQTAVAQQKLNSPYVRPGFQQMDSIGVSTMPHAA